MGPISISVEQVLVVIGGASTVTTAIFWGALLLGKLINRVDWIEKKVADHDRAIRLFKNGD